MKFDPEQLARWCKGNWSRLPDEAICGFTIDSRTVADGDCFVAIKTAKRDGHAFLEDAAAKGAVAAIVESLVDHELPQLVVSSSIKALQDCASGYRSTLRIPVIGISGSCGKTSTKDLLSKLLGEEVTLSTKGNLNNTLGVPLTLLRIDEGRHRFAVVEAGISCRGEMDTIASILKPSHGIITMVGEAHSEGLGGIKGIAEEKCKLLQAVDTDGVVLFPAACKVYAQFEHLAQKHVLTLAGPLKGTGDQTLQFEVAGQWPEPRPDKDFCARDTELESRDTETHRDRIHEHGRGPKVLILKFPAMLDFMSAIPPMSTGMASNAALAVTMAMILGIAQPEISRRLNQWQPSAGRGEVIHIGRQTYYVDCYNANPSSMMDTISFFRRQWSDVPKLYVLGTMNELGDAFDEGHEAVGAFLVLESHDQALFIGAGAAAFKRGVEKQQSPFTQYFLFSETMEAREHVEAFEGAILLKASRSLALERLIPQSQSSIHGGTIGC